MNYTTEQLSRALTELADVAVRVDVMGETYGLVQQGAGLSDPARRALLSARRANPTGLADLIAASAVPMTADDIAEIRAVKREAYAAEDREDAWHDRQGCE